MFPTFVCKKGAMGMEHYLGLLAIAVACIFAFKLIKAVLFRAILLIAAGVFIVYLLT